MEQHTTTTPLNPGTGRPMLPEAFDALGRATDEQAVRWTRSLVRNFVSRTEAGHNGLDAFVGSVWEHAEDLTGESTGRLTGVMADMFAALLGEALQVA